MFQFYHREPYKIEHFINHKSKYKMDNWPTDTIYYEQTGSTFTVYLVMNDVVISERIFQVEEEAKRCLEWYPILWKEPSIAIQEFQLKHN